MRNPIFFTPSDPIRVLRGGSWYFNARDTRVSNRSRNYASSRSGYLGFRIVCTKVES